MIRHGFSGKLPILGDFVSRGWSASTCGGLATLLQDTLAALLASSASARQLIAHAPPMVLSIRPGVIGAQGVVCVVLASHDRVGRTFPLCAGVAYDAHTAAAKAEVLDWPSLAYAHALIKQLEHGIDTQAGPDALLAHIEAVGDPRAFPAPQGATLHGCGADDTLPRLGRDPRLLRIQVPRSVLTPHLRALCSLLQARSDVLGMRLDTGGDVSDFFACRHVDARSAGPAWAALFDGEWVARGWTSYETSVHSGHRGSSDLVPHGGD